MVRRGGGREGGKGDGNLYVCYEWEGGGVWKE